jgi:hypothetical protein
MSQTGRRTRRTRAPAAPADPLEHCLLGLAGLRAAVDALKEEVFILKVRDQLHHHRLDRLEGRPPGPQEAQGAAAAPPADGSGVGAVRAPPPAS